MHRYTLRFFKSLIYDGMLCFWKSLIFAETVWFWKSLIFGGMVGCWNSIHKMCCSIVEWCGFVSHLIMMKWRCSGSLLSMVEY